MSIEINPSLPSTPVKTRGIDPSLTTPSHTPKKNYPLFSSPGGRIHIEMSPASKEAMRRHAGVYRFRKMETEKRYVGATQCLFKRQESHLSAINTPSTTTPLARAVREAPDTFTFGVIQDMPPGSDTDAAERRAIEKTDATRKGYNQRAGGGGGTCHHQERISKKAFKAAVKKFSEQYSSPTQYKFKSLKGRVSLRLPESVKKKVGVIYDIIESTPGGPVHYPGYTTGKMGKRMTEHLSLANNAQGAHLRAGFYRALASSPASFSVAVHRTDHLKVPIHVAERVVIAYFKEQGIAVRNQNGGGGGGRCKS